MKKVCESCEFCQHIMLIFSPMYLVVHGVLTRDVFSLSVASECPVSQMKAQSHYLSLLTSIFIFIFVTSASVLVFLMALLSNILLFLCTSFVMDVNRLPFRFFLLLLYDSMQEHMVRKLSQIPGMPV